MVVSLKPGVQRWLQDYCDSSDAVAAGVVLLSSSGHGPPQPVAEWPASGALSASLSAAAQASVQRDRPVVVAPALKRAGPDHNRVISMPLRAGDRPVGAIALAVRADDAAAVDRLCKDLASASLDVGLRLKRRTANVEPIRDGPNEAACVLELQSALLARATLAEGAMAMVTALAAQTGAERAVLGALGQASVSAMRILAVSGSAEFQREQNVLRLTSAAMQEAADQGARVDYPALVTDRPRIVLAHAELHALGGRSLVTVPLVDAGRAVGALLIELRAGMQPDDEQIRLFERVATAIGPLVALRERAERGWAARLGSNARSLALRLRQRDDPLPKVAAAIALAVLAVMALLPVPYRIGASARIEGVVQRVIAAPFDGFLQRSQVRPGDHVRAGDLLIEMADQDLALERRKWESTLAQQENASSAALARADRAQFVITQGKAEEARSQLALVRQQQSRTRLLAPIDGVVIKGDLSQALGAPVQRGDALMTLAPAEQYRLIVEVDERDIAAIRPGQSGQLVLASLPTDAVPLTVERVTPVSEVRDGRNVFEVEARLPALAIELRPGLQGVAKIDVGRHSIAWIWTHRVIDRLRLAWWSWFS